jgi:hypothetical protein
MGLLWIGLGVLAIAIVLHIAYDNWWNSPECFGGISIVSYFIGGVLVVVCGIACIACSISNDIEYQQELNKRDAIVYRLEHLDSEENLLVNGGVYDDVVEFNNNLLTYKTWTHNPWIGCFLTDKVAELDYIELPKGD